VAVVVSLILRLELLVALVAVVVVMTPQDHQVEQELLDKVMLVEQVLLEMQE
jgi:hypothetical protein